MERKKDVAAKREIEKYLFENVLPHDQAWVTHFFNHSTPEAEVNLVHVVSSRPVRNP